MKKKTYLTYQNGILFFLIPLFLIIAIVKGVTERNGIFVELFFVLVYILVIGYIYFKKQKKGSLRSTIFGALFGLVLGAIMYIPVFVTLLLIGSTESLQFTETTAYTLILLFTLLLFLFPVFGGILGYKWEKRKQIILWFVSSVVVLLIIIISTILYVYKF